jgi:hypothetical protein
MPGLVYPVLKMDYKQNTTDINFSRKPGMKLICVKIKQKIYMYLVYIGYKNIVGAMMSPKTGPGKNSIKVGMTRR